MADSTTNVNCRVADGYKEERAYDPEVTCNKIQKVSTCNTAAQKTGKGDIVPCAYSALDETCSAKTEYPWGTCD